MRHYGDKREQQDRRFKGCPAPCKPAVRKAHNSDNDSDPAPWNPAVPAAEHLRPCWQCCCSHGPETFFTHLPHFAKTKAVIPRRTTLECRTETAVLQPPRQRCALTPGAEGSAQTEAAGPTGHRRAHVNAGPYACFGCNSEPGSLQNNIPTWEEMAH